jgi:hypothetical protein
VALLGLESPGDLDILLPDDLDDFIIHPAVDVNVVQILETMQFFQTPTNPQNSRGDNVEPGIASIDPSDPTLSNEFPCPDNYFDTPENQIRVFPVPIIMRSKHLIHTPRRYLSKLRSCHGSLRTIAASI